ncbi:Exoenzyme S synthesis regulatory protein ExsA [Pseudomonas sp. 22 E 5]|uniref:AraC family transcriptional regulator n=1 Tax=Pseudomonas TaxID=286 RepID=UPI0008129B45|nr:MULTISPECIES: AraC family transcriptional regulator [Pseudomonas]NVZ83310.1 AraC family transcriptional regulator [Pseudomonas yamanorum]CRM89436.1 Exoenzyme S synthesis regulatory protein ExsA [Pseudomonas sp. 22 E 5]
MAKLDRTIYCLEYAFFNPSSEIVMHPFDSVLSAMQLESSLFVRMRAHAPWAISFDSGGQARLVVVAKGRGWFTHVGHSPVVVQEGDCLIIKQGVTGILGDTPDRVAVPCWQIADHVTGETVSFGGDGEACEFFSTLFTFNHAAGEPLSALLPDAVHIAMPKSDAGRMVSILEQIGAEEAQTSLGGSYVVGRLLDVLFIQAIRTWASSEGTMPEGWLAGMSHRQLAQTLRRIHADLAHPWTLDQLARNTGMSRSTFAALFKSIVGVPPLTYIATWRIYRAKLILAAGHSIAAAAEQTGYGSDIALSRAFKAATGVSPGQWRRERQNSGRSHPPIR